MSQTYAQFVASVVEELGIEGTRRGTEALRARSIRDACVDLQRFIRAFRQGHTTTYQVADLEAIGYAHLGTLPEQAKPKAFYTISTGDTETEGTTDDPNRVRNRLDWVPWEDRHARMVNRDCAPRAYLYTVSPFSRQFLVYPQVNAETELKVVWDGLKLAFADNDTVPWPEWAAEAVAAYVRWKLLVAVDRRLELAREWWDKARGTGEYPRLRLSLWREQNEAQTADGKDEEYEVGSVPNPTPLQGFGSQGIPFLATVTQVAGGDNTALAFVPTTSLTVPYAVAFLNGATLLTEIWILKAGTDASDGESVQRPNDYAAGTNEKVWYKQT